MEDYHIRPRPATSLANWTVAAEVQGSTIVVDTYSNFDDVSRRAYRDIMDTREKAVRDGLIALGWTPPREDEVPPFPNVKRARGYLDLLKSCSSTEQDRFDAERLLKEFLGGNRRALIAFAEERSLCP